MVKIIKKAMINRRNNQFTITIPKREFKKRFPKLRISEKTCFEIRPFIKKGRKEL